MSDFHYAGAGEYGMSGPAMGVVFWRGAMINDCINEPVFFHQEGICVFLCHTRDWYVHTDTHPLVGFHAPTGIVWAIDRLAPYGWLCQESSTLAKLVLKRHSGSREYDVTNGLDLNSADRLVLRTDPPCEECLESQRKFPGSACSQCWDQNIEFWEKLFPERMRMNPSWFKK